MGGSGAWTGPRRDLLILPRARFCVRVRPSLGPPYDGLPGQSSGQACSERGPVTYENKLSVRGSQRRALLGGLVHAGLGC